MKKILFLAVVILELSLNAQKTINNPTTGFSTTPDIRITKIECTDSSTVLHFHVHARPGNWISIPDKTYIQAVGSKEKLFVKRAEGIPMREKYTMPDSGSVAYKLYFEGIDEDVERIDFGEDNDGGTWFIYDVALTKKRNSIVPKELMGMWIKADGSNEWEYGFLDSVVIYKSVVWKYNSIEKIKKLYKLGVSSAAGTLSLFAKINKDGSCQLGENPKELKHFRHDRIKNTKYSKADDEVYKSPLFRNDSTIYCGYIKGYTSRAGKTTGLAYVNNILTGKQESYTIRIAEDGTFKVSFPFYYPHLVFVRFPFNSATILLEPGKELFHLISPGSREHHSLFMGDLARTNSDLQRVKNLHSIDHRALTKKVLDLNPEEYKQYCLKSRDEALKRLYEQNSENPFSAKALQLKTLDIKFGAAAALFRYNLNRTSAYRRKHNIPRNQREIPLEKKKLDSGYYSFLGGLNLNDPVNVISTEYGYCLNGLKYSDLLRDGTSKSLDMHDLAEWIEKKGIKLSETERKMLIANKNLIDPEQKARNEAFSREYGNSLTKFMKKHARLIDSLKKLGLVEPSFSPQSIEAIRNSLTEISEHENKMLTAVIDNYAPEPVKKNEAYLKEFGETRKEFNKKYGKYYSRIFAELATIEREEKMGEIMEERKGVCLEIMRAQDDLNTLEKDYTPYSEDEIVKLQGKYSNEFIGEYIAGRNDHIAAKIEANKTKGGYTVNKVPETEADQLFDAMVKKYNGKVVYIDFWATWCGPCRSAMERIKPLKEELKDEDIVFVYITNPSSPNGTWKSLLPEIKGEHFRLTQDEWNILSGKFGISGIPHYVMLDKKGVVVNNNRMPRSGDRLKNILMVELNK